MKPIKYRAWHKREKKMYYVAALFFTGVDGLSVFLSDGIALYDVERDAIELMQWTGLEDYKGKAIYEGDVIMYRDNTSHGLVDKIVDIEDIRELPDFTCSKWQRVIGNIYQNPELVREPQ